ncbi:MAG: YncE family protein [Planctomycetota bacterium]
MKRVYTLAAALLLALAAPRPATAIDKVEAEEIDFGDLEVAQALPSEDGSQLYLIEAAPTNGAAPKSRLIFWDLAKGAIDKELKLPKSPTQMALAGGKLVVACRESEVVVLVDPKEKKIQKTVETSIDGETIAPWSLVRDAPAGKAMVFLLGDAQRQDGEGGLLAELDVATGKLSTFCRGGPQAAFGKEYAILGERGGIVLEKLSSLRRRGPKGHSPVAREMQELQLALARPVNGGTQWIVPNLAQRKTTLVSQDFDKQLWTTDGILAGLYRGKPIALVTAQAMDDMHSSDKWTLRGIHSGSGRQVFRIAIKLTHAIDRWELQQGQALEVIEKKSGDELLFGMSKDRRHGELVSRTWYRAALPKSDADAGPASVGSEPPAEMAVGETFEWQPTLGKTAKDAKFVLKQGPDGMTVDAKTGKLSWKPDDAGVGKHDVELVAKVGDDEFPILNYTLRVRAAKSKKGADSDKDEEKDE